MNGEAQHRQRDVRLDFFRGLALVCIFVDHIPGNALAHFTLRNFGFADAAEVFVALAGYAAYGVYGRLFAMQGPGAVLAKIGRRIRDLYLAHILLLIVCVGGLVTAARALENPGYLEHTNLTYFHVDPAGAIWRALLLVHQPGYLDILPLYIALLVWLPILLWLMRRHIILALAVSAAFWLAANFLDVNLPNLPEHRGWYFNPFAWQLLFSLGVIAGHLADAGKLPLRSTPLLVLAFSYALFVLLIAAPWTSLPGLSEAKVLPADVLSPISKRNLSLWRIAHIISLAQIVACLIPRRARWLDTSWARALGDCGRHSLPVFSLGTALSMLGFIVIGESGGGIVSQIFVSSAGIALLVFAGLQLSSIERATARAQPLSRTRRWAWQVPAQSIARP